LTINQENEDLAKQVNKLLHKTWALIGFMMLLLATQQVVQAQPTGTGATISYASPREYVIAGIEIRGAQYSDINTIRLFSGLQVGDRVNVPGEKISKAIKNLWQQELFTDIRVSATSIEGENIFLAIDLVEVPRLAKWNYEGLSRGEQESINDKIELLRGGPITENMVGNIKRITKAHFLEKGFYNVSVDVRQKDSDTIKNGKDLVIDVEKGVRIKVRDIIFEGNVAMAEKKLLRKMKNTKEKRWWRIFKTSKLIEDEFAQDKAALLAVYNKNGYRDARILGDSIWKNEEGSLDAKIKLTEGSQYYFRDINFVGNTKYNSDTLRSVLGIRRGDVYDTELLNTKIFQNPKGVDISALYQGDGYLTFQIYPVELRAENDSIDLEIRMVEGKQFRIGKVTVLGNTKTNDHVVYREIRTMPGDLFSRSNIMRTQRELAALGYFNPEAFGVNPIQHPETGLVDLEYIVEEKPSDQIELSGGFGQGRVVGTLGLRFTNFSARNMFRKGYWRPVPSGDGQQLSIRGQTNGIFFQSVSASFVEPWLGGKKPNSFSISTSWSRQTNGQKGRFDNEGNSLFAELNVIGGSIGYGKRLQKPDDWFSVFANVSYQNFRIDNFGSFFSFAEGTSNNAALSFTIQRNSANDPIFPKSGSNIKFTTKATLPYSLFSNKTDEEWAAASDQEKFRWVEYHKYKFTAEWFTPLTRGGKEGKNPLVLRTSAGFGLMGAYNKNIGVSPFERFYLGGVFLSGFVLDGREIINLRGYDDRSLSPQTGAPIITKLNAELRYPLSTNPSATVFMLGFAEAGSTFQNFQEYNPFELQRSAGVGLRVFLPMFGLLGLDYGWRFDDVPGLPGMPRSQFHFSIGANVGDL